MHMVFMQTHHFYKFNNKSKNIKKITKSCGCRKYPVTCCDVDTDRLEARTW